jgi:myosin-3
VAKLLSLNSDELSQSLTSEATVTRGEQIIRHRNVVQAADCRDALAKAIYGKLFAWIVNSINHLLQKPEDWYMPFC